MHKDRLVLSRGIANVLRYLGEHVISLMVIYFCLRLTDAPHMITSTLAWALYMAIGYNMGRADVTVLEESRRT